MKRMRVVMFFFPLLLYTYPYYPIPDIQGQGDISPLLGDTVSTRGVVTGVYWNSFFLEEKPAGTRKGIYVYRGPVDSPAVQIGDSVEVGGLVYEYNNLTEILANDSLLYYVNLISPGVTLPETLVVTISDATLNGEDYEGTLVRINTVHFKATGTFQANQGYYIFNETETESIKVWIRGSTDIPGTSIPEGTLDIVACHSQYYSEYELIPRFTDDFIVYGNLPPLIGYVFRRPYTPSSDESVFVEAQAEDADGYVALDYLYYSTGAVWYEVAHDSASGNLYYFTIPAQAEGTEVSYFFKVVDDVGSEVYSDTFSYTVTSVPLVKINEIFYDAANDGTQGTEPYSEWIEIHNIGTSTIDLSGWVIADDPNPFAPSGLYDGSFVLPSVSLGPDEFLILAFNADTFNYYWPDHGSAQVIAYGDVSTIYLGNDGEDIHLFDASMVPVDVVWYGHGGDLYQMGHAGMDVAAGSSLLRVYDDFDTDDPLLDFADTLSPNPGYRNYPYRCGDANGDGNITSSDAITILLWLIGQADITSCYSANTNGDSTVSASDAIQIILWTVGFAELTCYPCQGG